MTETEMMVALERITGEEDSDILATYLDIAAEAVIHKAYPFRDDVTVVPKRYQATQLDIAGYLLNKRGAEGETYHSENGINRSYESAGIPASMLAGVTPFAGVF